MKRIVLASLLFATAAAWAGEHCIGLITVSDGGSVSNATTGYGTVACATSESNACGCAQAFSIGLNQKLTIQSDLAVIFGADYAVDAGNGLVLPAAQIFPTSTSPVKQRAPLPDAGAYWGGLVWCTQANGAAATTCRVMTRNGNE